MTRRWPSIIVATVCCLFTVATPAYAACAWVLWHDDQSTDTRGNAPPRQWYLVASYPTAAECTKAIDIREADARKAKWIVDRKATTDLFIGQQLSNSPYRVMSGYQCMPDTIDPRGPKGK
jgi:hypothetical protein